MGLLEALACVSVGATAGTYLSVGVCYFVTTDTHQQKPDCCVCPAKPVVVPGAPGALGVPVRTITKSSYQILFAGIVIGAVWGLHGYYTTQ